MKQDAMYESHNNIFSRILFYVQTVDVPLRKLAYVINRDCLSLKMKIIIRKILISFLIFAQNIDCGTS